MAAAIALAVPVLRMRRAPKLGTVPCPWCGDLVLWVPWSRRARADVVGLDVAVPARPRRRRAPRAKDMTGIRVGRLVVLERAPSVDPGGAQWRCQCDCGGTTVVRGGNLRVSLSGSTKGVRSCGCIQRDKRLAAALAAAADTLAVKPRRRGGAHVEDLTGFRSGRLMAAAQVPRPEGKTYGTWWRCDCDCGGAHIVVANSLKRGATRSCGCLSREAGHAISERNAEFRKTKGLVVTTAEIVRLRRYKAEPDPRPPELVAERPRTRGDCAGGERPCPWVSCKHHLYLDVGTNGRVAIDGAGEPWDMAQTCALDVADQGPQNLETIGGLLNVSRERIRQIEVRSIDALRGETRDADLEDWRSVADRETP